MAEQIITKRCPRCKEVKEISEFYRSHKRKDGHQSCCKICQNKYQKSQKGKIVKKRYNQSEKGKESLRRAKARYKVSEKAKATKKNYRQTEKYKTYNKRVSQKNRLTHPEQIKAVKAVEGAIRKGQLPRPDSLKCSICPKMAQQYHHHKGYEPEHWLDVIPVCIPCHNKLPIESLCDIS